MLVGAKQASATIVYSGANRNIVYEQYNSPYTISLFDAPGTWDDMYLFLTVMEDSTFLNTYRFGNMLEVHGNYVKFAIGDYYFDIKNFGKGDVIDGSSIFSGNNYKDFSYYAYEFEFDTTIVHGEFRNLTGYAGLLFMDEDAVFYGWMQVSITNYNNSYITATLIDWAYESTPGVGIRAGVIPEPTVCALLLAGCAAALAIFRRQRA